MGGGDGWSAMSRAAGSSLRHKVMVVVLVTTCMALLLSATALLIYELRSYQKTWIDDLNTQARIIASASGPALNFDDPKVASENLALLALRPQITAAAVYRADGRLFARYQHSDATDDIVPPVACPPGIVIDNGDAEGLVRAIRGLRDNPARREELGRNARAACERLFDTRVACARIEEILKSVVK